MTDTTSYHVSTLGSWASSDLRPDLDGYIHLTAEAVLSGRWDTIAGEIDQDQAEEIAEQNRAATAESEAMIGGWRAQ